MGVKKGSLFYGVMILILCTSLLVRQGRLVASHLYLEQGIYSMDLRIESFRQEMDRLTEELNLRFDSYDAFDAHMTSIGSGAKKITIQPFEITRDNTYNEGNIFMLRVKLQGEQSFRFVMVVMVNDKITLNVRGV